MKFGSFIFLFILCTVSYGQGSNPFDIPQNGEKAMEVVIPEHIEDLDTLTKSNNNVDASTETIAPTINIDAISNNPFDISPNKPQSATPQEPSAEEVAIPHSNNDEPWNIKLIVLIYSLVMMIILTLSIGMDRKRFNSVLKSSFNSNNLKTLYRDTKAWANPQFIILYIFFILNMAFMTWLILLKSSIIVNLFILIGGVLTCYTIRHLVMWSITTIYPVGKEADLHNYSIAIHNSILGILLLPVILIAEFMPSFDITALGYLAIFVVALMYVLRQSKGLLSCIGMRGFNPFYFFVYLCAIEIAPILVGIKMMIGAL